MKMVARFQSSFTGEQFYKFHKKRNQENRFFHIFFVFYKHIMNKQANTTKKFFYQIKTDQYRRNFTLSIINV